jgi:hypothetical protein
MFDAQGIERSLRNRDDNAAATITRLRNSLSAHQLGRRPNDDQTAVAIHVQNDAKVAGPMWRGA